MMLLPQREKSKLETETHPFEFTITKSTSCVEFLLIKLVLKMPDHLLARACLKTDEA